MPSETSSESSEYGGIDVTFDDDITPAAFTVVQEASNKSNGYQAEHSLLGNTEVQEWRLDLANEMDAMAATPSQCKVSINV